MGVLQIVQVYMNHWITVLVYVIVNISKPRSAAVDYSIVVVPVEILKKR